MSRERILSKIRAQLGVEENAAQRNDAVTQRISESARNLIPARAQKPRDELIVQFIGFLEGQSARVIKLESAEAVPEAVASYLRDSNLPQAVRMGSDPWLTWLPWREAASLEVANGPAAADDAVGISHALAGISETGTLVLASGADNPVTLGFLPENHIIVVDAATIVGSLEEGIALARSRLPGRIMPRTLNLISGASRTADIGGRLVVGAHGPRRLAVMIVESGARV